MHTKVGEIMTRRVTRLPASATVREAARQMKDRHIGSVIVEKNDALRGIVTDRDIVVRCIATGGDPDEVTLELICSPQLAVLSPEDPLEHAVSVMRKKAIRRIPVVENDEIVGMLSLGDLAVEREPGSALGGISAAVANP